MVKRLTTLLYLAAVGAVQLSSRSSPTITRRMLLGTAPLAALPALGSAANARPSGGTAADGGEGELTPKEKGALRIAELSKVVRLPFTGTGKEPTLCEKCFTMSCINRECVNERRPAK